MQCKVLYCNNIFANRPSTVLSQKSKLNITARFTEFTLACIFWNIHTTEIVIITALVTDWDKHISTENALISILGGKMGVVAFFNFRCIAGPPYCSVWAFPLKTHCEEKNWGKIEERIIGFWPRELVLTFWDHTSAMLCYSNGTDKKPKQKDQRA